MGMIGSRKGAVAKLALLGVLATSAAHEAARAAEAGAKPASEPAKKPAGPSPFTDYKSERPGKRLKITAADLPPPRVNRSIDNPPRLVQRPEGAWPQAPAGFTVQLYADGLSAPRLIRTAPNGDVFVVESEDGVVRVMRGVLTSGKASWSGVFAKGFKRPFGIAFYPPGGDPRW